MRDLEHAKSQLDQQGYCIVEGVIGRDAAASLRDRLNEQVPRRNSSSIAASDRTRNAYVSFLLNKGQGFRDLLFVAEMRALVEHILGPHYLLSSYSGHLALPGGSRVFHRDQWWMPVPIIRVPEYLVARRSLRIPATVVEQRSPARQDLQTRGGRVPVSAMID